MCLTSKSEWILFIRELLYSIAMKLRILIIQILCAVVYDVSERCLRSYE